MAVDPGASRKLRRWIIGAVVILALAVTLGTVLIASSFRTTAQQAAEASPPPPSRVTEEVTDQDLRVTTSLVCTPERTGVTELSAPAVGEGSAGAQYTSVDIRRDELLGNGSLVATVNGRPLFTLIGGFSLYRDLRLEDQGPDAALLNDSLAALGWQAPRVGTARETVTAETYTALRRLHASFGFTGPEDEDPLRASDFLVLREPSTVITDPRSTGAVADGPLAQVSHSSVELHCLGANGSLTPEARTGQQISFPLWPGQSSEITVREVQDSAASSVGAEQEDAAGVAPQEGAAPDAEGAAGTTTTAAVVTLDAEQQRDLPDQLTGELTLDSYMEARAVVSSAALWTRDGQTHVTVLEGEQEQEIPVQVLFTADGLNAVQSAEGADPEGLLTPGATVLISPRGGA